MVKKLLFHYAKFPWVAYFGNFIGLTFLFLSVHYLFKFQQYGAHSETLKVNTLILQKKVTYSTTLQIAKSDFSQQDIQLLKELPAVSVIEPVVNNQFRVWLETNDRMLPIFKTDVFLQAVANEFLDVQTPEWKWEKGDKKVPIIMPRDFLVMMNTFLSASGMPQISDELATQVNFKIRISNGQEQEWYDSKIVGFTNEVAALLVPKSFMTHANSKFGHSENQKITQLMVATKKGQFGEIEQYMNENGLEAKKSHVLINRLKSVVNTLLFIVLSISFIALVNAMFVLIQYLQLLLSRNEYSIKVLLRIGHHIPQLVRHFVIYLGKQFFLLSSLSFLTFYLLKLKIDQLFLSGGVYLDASFNLHLFTVFFFIQATFILAVFLTSKKGIKELFRT
jgi:hypothetical protein